MRGRGHSFAAAWVCTAAVLLGAPPARAQDDTRAAVDARFDALVQQKWEAAMTVAVATASSSTPSMPPTLADWRTQTPRARRQSTYAAIIADLVTDRELTDLFDANYVRAMVAERADSRLPVSTNATASNPVTSGLTERSGGTSLASLASDLSSVASADKSAVSLSLSALALVSAKDPTVYSSMAAYQDHGFARRFTGTVTFGAKIPEKEITGLSSLPSFDTMLDAFAWDVKARVFGDKDVRSARWLTASVRDAGMRVQLAALLPTIALDPGDAAADASSLAALKEDGQILNTLLTTVVKETVHDVVQKAARSAQLSVKAAGTHLTKEAGKNKYSFTALFDQGVGPTDITANVQYAVTDDVRLGAGNVFQVKLWTMAASLTSHLAADAIVPGRTLDLNLGGSASIFQDAERLPVRADNTWKLFTTIDIPVGGGGKVPLSIVYSNDPNALTKQKYVSGLIGLSYDFSALKALFK